MKQILRCIQHHFSITDIQLQIFHTSALLGSALWPFTGSENNSNNQAVQTKGFSEDKNKHHGNEQFGLLAVSTNTGITNDPNAQTSAKGAQTTAQTGGKVRVTGEARVRRHDLL